MKKTMLAGAFTLVAAVAFAEADLVESFEGYSENDSISTSGHIMYGKDGYKSDISDDDNGSKVALFADDEAPADAARPDGARDTETNLNYLNLSTEGNTLYFAAKTLDGSELDTESLAIDEETPYYIDTMVKFTASEEAQTPEDGAKIAIWTQKAADAQEGDPATLWIAAGTASDEGGLWHLVKDEKEQVVVTNFDTEMEIADGWHRLTVKAMMLNGLPAFEVYIDGNENAVGTYYSLSDAPDFTAMGFTGTGALDDVVLTADCPEFLIPPSFTFTLSYVADEDITDKLTATLNDEKLTIGEAFGEKFIEGTSVELALTPEAGYEYKLYKDPGKAEEFDGNIAAIEFGTSDIQLYVDVSAVTPAGPTVDEEGAKIELVGSDYVVTPAEGKTSVTVDGLPDDFAGKVIVPVAAIDTITGVPAANLQLTVNGVVIPNTYFEGGVDSFSTKLSDAAKPAFADEATDEAKPLVVGDDVTLAIKSVAGLKYELLRDTDLTTATFETAADAKIGNGEVLTLTDDDKPEGKAFYKVRVSKGAVKLQ